MEISGLLTDDLPTRQYCATPTASPQFNHTYVPQPPAPLSMSDEPRQVLFHCSTHGRIPLRLELRTSLHPNDIDTLVRTFFAIDPADEVSYYKDDQRFDTVGYLECAEHSEFVIRVAPGQYYQEGYPQQQGQPTYNLRHSHPHTNGFAPANRTHIASSYKGTRSISPSSGRGRRSGSATGSGRSRSMKRQNSNTSHPKVEQLVDDFFSQSGNAMHPPQQYSDATKGGKLEPVARAEISLDNIVEGSRRKRPKFSSSELPLFPKPLHPASYSPSRPIMPQQTLTPHAQYQPQQMPTPQSASPYSYGAYSRPPPYHGRPYTPNFPTPAPTIATDISDEDVAIQLMRLGEASTCSNSPSTLDETADDAGNFSEDQHDDARSDTTELPELPPTFGEDDETLGEMQGSPSYSKNSKKFKSLDEILPSFDTTEPSDNEEAPQPTMAKREIMNNAHNARHVIPSEDDYDDYEDVADETYIVEREEDDDGEYLEDDRTARSLSSGQVRKAVNPSRPKSLNQVKPGRVVKKSAQPQQGIAATPKAKPKPTTALCTAFSHATKNGMSKVPISPSSPTMYHNPSTTSSVQSHHNHNVAAKSRSTSSSSLPTPISGIQMFPPPHSHSNHFHSHNTTLGLLMGGIPLQDEEPEKPKPRCQRCRKSKKGCDRQRPCQRCKDAGIGIEGCISEDESGTRRGRAGGAAKKAAAQAGAGANVNGTKKAVKTKRKRV